LPLICVGGIERDPEKDEAGVIIVAALLGASNPADGTMHTQTHGFRKVAANGALLGFQRRVVENILHSQSPSDNSIKATWRRCPQGCLYAAKWPRSEEHTSELQSRENLVCRLLL